MGQRKSQFGVTFLALNGSQNWIFDLAVPVADRDEITHFSIAKSVTFCTFRIHEGSGGAQKMLETLYTSGKWIPDIPLHFRN